MRCVTQCCLIERYQTTPCHTTKECNLMHSLIKQVMWAREGGRGVERERERERVIFETGHFISVTQFLAFIVPKNLSAEL